MSARLEPVYLANVLLHVTSTTAITAFPFVSKRCREATLTLKVNPAAFTDSPRAILSHFPNINTMVVRDLSCFTTSGVPPDTVTSLIVTGMAFGTSAAIDPTIARLVVELHISGWGRATDVDLSAFVSLERLATVDVPKRVVLPPHTLRRVTVVSTDPFSDPLAVFPPACAEQVVLLFDSPYWFDRAKERQQPPNVRLLCCEVNSDVAAEEFRALGTKGVVTLSEEFGDAELRAFNTKVLLPYTDVDLRVHCRRPSYDLSFLTNVTRLSTVGMTRCSCALPTSVVSLTVKSASSVALSGTEHLTSLTVPDETVVPGACPALRELDWHGEAFTREAVWFPASLTALQLDAFRAFDVACLAPFTNLRRLRVSRAPRDPLDLRPLETLTRLVVLGTPVASIPTSLVECYVFVAHYFDFVPFSQLTSLSVALMKDASVTFPSQLRDLSISGGGRLNGCNIAQLHLESLDYSNRPDALTRERLEALPKSLRRLKAVFNPRPLREQLGEIFPLFEGWR